MFFFLFVSRPSCLPDDLLIFSKQRTQHWGLCILKCARRWHLLSPCLLMMSRVLLYSRHLILLFCNKCCGLWNQPPPCLSWLFHYFLNNYTEHFYLIINVLYTACLVNIQISLQIYIAEHFKFSESYLSSLPYSKLHRNFPLLLVTLKWPFSQPFRSFHRRLPKCHFLT
jgi:hypothetical protein